MRVAYLVNQYPKVSHSFVRREIHALERTGINIVRVALRGWNDVVVDNEDILERERTHYVLKGGMVPLIIAVVGMLFKAPYDF